MNGPGGSMWTNLGYWVRATDAAADTRAAAVHYTEAAEALARRVAAAARLAPDDVVVDYACGFGDSLRLWVEAYGARSVVGIEPDPHVCRVIESRVRAWGLANRITVICAAAEAVAPPEAAAGVTAVVCVDAAYHFATRHSWIASLGASAPVGLRFGLADLCVPDAKARSLRLRALARLMRIPRHNLVSARNIAMGCEDAGFTVHHCTPVGAAVLDGFVAHAPLGTMPVAVTRAAIALARRAGLLDYFVMGAER